MTLKIELDTSDVAVCSAIGTALLEISGALLPRAIEELVEPGAAITRGAGSPKPAIDGTIEELKQIQKESQEAAVAQETQSQGASNAGKKDPAGANNNGAAAEAKGSKYDGQTDEKGVLFNPDFCAVAAEPFNKSGPNKGQWKRKRGVDEQRYNQWYTAAMPEAALDEEVQEKPVDTGAAFNQTTQAAAPAEGEPEWTGTKDDAGILMRWVTEKMAAGVITQDDVNEAYTFGNLTPGDLFQDDKRQSVIDVVYGYLSQKG